MLSQRQTDERYLIISDKIKQSLREERCLLHSKYTNFWSDRLAIVENDYTKHKGFWSFTAVDVLMNESRPIRFPKSDKKFYSLHIFSINEEFGFLLELEKETFRVNFVRFDWDSNEFLTINHFEKQREYVCIFMDNMNPQTFIFQWYKENDLHRHKYQLCKFVNGKVEFGEIHELDKLFCFYSDEKLIRVGRSFPPRIQMYDLASKTEHQSLETDSSLLTENVIEWKFTNVEWFNGRLYSPAKFQNSQNYGIIWADLNIKRWALMDFKTNFKICRLEFLNESLIVSTINKKRDRRTAIYESEANVYSIPMRKPNHLRKMAWLLVVKIMKEKGEIKPYEKAKEYLPLNSDLRALWFKDEEKAETT